MAEWNPVNTMAESPRRFFGNPSGEFGSDPLPSLDHPIACTAPWIFAIVAVCAPLAIRGCQRTVAD